MCPPPPEEPADDSLNSDLQHMNRSVLSLTVYLGCVLHVCYVKFLPLYVFPFSLRVVLLKRRELREIRCLPLIKTGWPRLSPPSPPCLPSPVLRSAWVEGS